MMEEKEEREEYGIPPGAAVSERAEESGGTEAAALLPAEDAAGEEGEDSSFSGRGEEAGPAEDAVEKRSLDEALAFALLFAPLAGSGADEGALFKRYWALRSLGLSVREAFSAASCSVAGSEEAVRAPASKAHLISGVPKGCDRGLRLAGEELRLARELLGDDYSGEELASLYRRVTK